MPYEETIPPPGPSTQHHHRRKIDHVDWMKVARAVLLSLPMWGSGLWMAVTWGLEAHSQWLLFKELPAKIVALEKVAGEHVDLVKRLASLERYRCILGYDPGGKFGEKTTLPRDRRNECRVTAIPEMAAAPAPGLGN
jgi:hypothetical protein